MTDAVVKGFEVLEFTQAVGKIVFDTLCADLTYGPNVDRHEVTPGFCDLVQDDGSSANRAHPHEVPSQSPRVRRRPVQWQLPPSRTQPYSA